MKKWFLPLIFVIFLMVSCGETTGEKPVNKGLAGFAVEFSKDFDLGSPQKRIGNYGEDIVTKINITALGYDNKPLTDYSGEIEIGLLYGEIKMENERPMIHNGYAGDIEVKMRNCLDNNRVVVKEVKKHEGDETTEQTGKMGVSPVFYPQVATISAIQGTIKEGTKGNQSAFNKRNLTLKDRKMVVTAVIEGGFYLHEVGVDDYSSIYMYTYSTPYVDDNIEDTTALPVGALIESANGSVFEFFGFTEMSFPTFKPVYVEKDGKMTIKTDKSLIPEPKDISEIIPEFIEIEDGDEGLSETEKENKKAKIKTHNKMVEKTLEKYEASLVTVKNVAVEWFNENDSSFVEYSQFPLRMNTSDKYVKRHILAQTLYTAPLFNAVAEKPQKETGESLHHYNFTGILKQHTSARPTWILVPRDMNDIECLDCDE
jgi:hypothetical protein